jgi:hypothetical protein
VHPHEVSTLCIFIGVLPVFVNLYLATTDLSWGVASKFSSVFSQVNWANAELADRQKIKAKNFIGGTPNEKTPASEPTEAGVMLLASSHYLERVSLPAGGGGGGGAFSVKQQPETPSVTAAIATKARYVKIFIILASK